jgi:tRNA A37 threonylcarbamoyladenosine synthetase subunit TsaC/SUA5/YrdC
MIVVKSIIRTSAEAIVATSAALSKMEQASQAAIAAHPPSSVAVKFYEAQEIDRPV